MPQEARPRTFGPAQRALVVAGLVVIGAALLVALGVAWLFAGRRAESATIELVTSPPGASVRVDGQPRAGATPLVVSDGLSPGGTHRIELELDGYATSVVDLPVAAGMQRHVVVLAPLPARMRIETEPVGASLMVDGVLRGPSPVELTGTAGQELEVRVLSPSGPPTIRRVRFARGDSVERIAVGAP